MRFWWAALLFLCTGLAAPAKADELRPGYIEFTQTDATHWQLLWKAPMRGGVLPSTQPILPKGCVVAGAPSREMVSAAVVTTFAVTCSGEVAGGQIGLSNFAASQTDVLVRVAPLGRPVQALRLTAAAPLATILARPGRWQVARTYFVTGVEHILFGYDHLLFVVSLVLLLNGFWTVAKAVTAFTIAHSITLVGTTLGFLGLPQRPVESVIALSIMFLAVEILKKQPDAPRLSERIPWVVAFGFGLLHGFGFAGALNEIGLPESDVPTALLTFNLGVEAGQLMIVLATAALLGLLRRYAAAAQPLVVRVASYAIGSIAAFWFIERTFA
jgi:hydrogenase/urease accessory protein HupE